MINETETIAAISTGAGNSGIGIVRISGEESFEIIKKIFRPARPKDMGSVPSHTVHYGRIEEGGEVIDEVLVTMMKGPHTYTCEDTAEINCHGGAFVQRRVLETAVRAGARIAEPGEFTKRAFLNGRIDLSQAEAVIDIINAENDFALKSAERQLRGSVSEKIRAERAILLEQTAYIEAALDDPEHIEMEGYGEKLLPVVEGCRKDIDALIRSADDGHILKEGIRTVIVGKPNVGKSSLLNALLEEERAIVTDIAGTTRDVLEEHIRLDGLVLNVVDTAGIRSTDDIIEKIGVAKAKKYAKEADLIIFVADGSAAPDRDDEEILRSIKGRRAIALLNKRDIGTGISTEDFEKRFGIPAIGASLREGRGREELVLRIREMFFRGEIDFNNQVYITNERQKNALIAAQESLLRVEESIRQGVSEDFYTIDLLDAYENLGLVTGEAISDDLADEIFSRFCMGK